LRRAWTTYAALSITVGCATVYAGRPCYVARYYSVGGSIHNICVALEPIEDGRHAWIGLVTIAILLLPVKREFLTHDAKSLLHVVNLVWVAFALMLLSLSCTSQSKLPLAAFLKDVGILTGRCCNLNMCFLLISLGRCSVWLDKFGAAYADGISLHRIAGWWCIGHVALHGVAFLSLYLYIGGYHMVFKQCLPFVANLKQSFLNMYGLVAALASFILARLSKKDMRRQKYEIFYCTHVWLSAAFILLSIFHDISVLSFTLPACSYIIETVTACFSSQASFHADLACLLPDVLRFTLPAGSLTPCRKLVPGTRWAYVKVPTVSPEWHPLSIFGPPSAPMIHMKVVGDWTRSLMNLAQTQTKVDLQIRGPYGVVSKGCPWGMAVGTLDSQLSDFEKSANKVVVAGGLGIVPWADEASSIDASIPWRSVQVTWIVRTVDAFEALDRSLQIRAHAKQGIEVHVYITGECLSLPVEPAQEAPLTIGHTNDSANTEIGLLTIRSWVIAALMPGCALCSSAYIQSFLSQVTHHSKMNPAQWSFLTRGGAIVLTYGSMFLILLALAGCMRILWYVFRVAPRSVTVIDGPSNSSRDVEHRMLLEHNSESVKIMHGRPNLSEIICKQGACGNLIVEACGPDSLLQSCRQAVSEASSRGHIVALKLIESHW